MPRGVRNDGQPRAKPGRKPKAAPAAVVVAAVVPEPPAAPAVAPRRDDPLQRNRNMALMSEAELREYALQVGVPKRDAQSLSVDRLRQNCALVLQAYIEDL